LHAFGYAWRGYPSLPPFIVDAPVLDTIVEGLGEAIDAATHGLC
jgi:hypothetical protein